MDSKLMVYLALGVGAYFVFFHKNAAGQTIVQQMGGAGGTISSSPSTQYPLAVPQAARADNNPALNNQPWAQKIVNTVQSSVTPANVASAASSVAGIFQSLFSSSSGGTDSSGDAPDNSDLAMSTDMAGEANMGSGYDDSSLYDGSYDDSDNFGFANA
jgi:hypothetical protein